MSNEPRANRFTLPAAQGYKISHFGRGLLYLMLEEQARTGRSLSYPAFSARAGVSIPTLRKVLLDIGTFDVDTLQRMALALGAKRWEDVVKLADKLPTTPVAKKGEAL